MPFNVGPDSLLKVIFRGNVLGQEFRLRRFYITPQTNVGMETSQFILESLKGALWDTLKALLSTECRLNDIYIVQQNVPPPGTPQEDYLSVEEDGGLADSSLPPQDAVVFRLRTGFVGRDRRGRVFIPGVSINAIEEGVLKAAAYSDFWDAAQAWSDIIPGEQPENEIVPCHARQTGTWTAQFVDYFNVSDVDQILRTQRRRQVGRGM